MTPLYPRINGVPPWHSTPSRVRWSCGGRPKPERNLPRPVSAPKLSGPDPAFELHMRRCALRAAWFYAKVVACVLFVLVVLVGCVREAFGADYYHNVVVTNWTIADASNYLAWAKRNGFTVGPLQPFRDPSIVTPRFLDAIMAVESGGRDTARGKRGELGAFQFRRAAWADVQRMTGWRQPFTSATNRTTSRTHAARYLRHLETSLIAARGRQPTRAELFAAWNLGFAGFRRRDFSLLKCPAAVRDAAGRVENLTRRAGP